MATTAPKKNDPTDPTPQQAAAQNGVGLDDVDEDNLLTGVVNKVDFSLENETASSVAEVGFLLLARSRKTSFVLPR